MRYLPVVTAACCVVAVLMGPASVLPAAGQGPGPRHFQVQSGETERSNTRTTIGSALLAMGAAGAYAAYYRCEVGGPDSERYTGKYGDGGCELEPYPVWGHDVFAKHVPYYEGVAVGAGLAALGLLLTTVWSGVEVEPAQNGGVEVTMSVWPR